MARADVYRSDPAAPNPLPKLTHEARLHTLRALLGTGHERGAPEHWTSRRRGLLPHTRISGIVGDVPTDLNTEITAGKGERPRQLVVRAAASVASCR
jgi:hypothetical protein